MTARRLAVAALVGALGLAAVPTTLAAQDGAQWRTVELSRQLRDTLPQRVKVQYSAGRVDVRATPRRVLYDMQLRYDEARSVPLHEYDAVQHSVRLGLATRTGASRVRREAGELRLALPVAVPLDLDLAFGGTEARLDLGGLALRSLRLECGATDATLAFNEANRARMAELEVNVGAAEFKAIRLANANADAVLVRAGVGAVDLDFSGQWTRDMSLSVRVAVGSLVLRVPADVGLRVELERFAVGFEHSGLVKRDDAWYSANFETARHKLRVRAAGAVGGIEVRHLTR